MKKSIRNKSLICIAVVFAVLVVDQCLKIWVKTTFPLGGKLDLIGQWCQLYFIENEGMAFGLSFGESTGKLLLTLFRLVASIAIGYYIVRLLRRNERMAILLSLTLIFVGALGNLIDSCFYGLIFSESTHLEAAMLFPPEGGYGTFMHGRVVDMFYFPMFHWVWPDWVPFVGGTEGEFFNAIFNFADAAVCCGVGLLIVDQCIAGGKKKNNADADDSVAEEPNFEDPEPGTVEK